MASKAWQIDRTADQATGEEEMNPHLGEVPLSTSWYLGEGLSPPRADVQLPTQNRCPLLPSVLLGDEGKRVFSMGLLWVKASELQQPRWGVTEVSRVACPDRALPVTRTHPGVRHFRMSPALALTVCFHGQAPSGAPQQLSSGVFASDEG